MQLPSSVCTISRWRFLIIYVFIFGCTGSLLLHRRLSSCGEQGLLSSGPRASHRRGFSCCRAQTLGHKGSVLVAHGLSCSVARGISLDQGSNLVLCSGWHILCHWDTKEAAKNYFNTVCGDSISLLSVCKLKCYFLSQQLLKWSSQKKDILPLG